jgi:hypothetical protein
VLLAAAVLLAGCGGEARPRLSEQLADSVAADADAIAAELEARRHCPAARRADRLVGNVVAAINARGVPNGLQEDLLGRVNELAGRIGCPGPSEPQAASVALELADWVRKRS